MKIPCLTSIVCSGLLASSCSQKSADDSRDHSNLPSRGASEEKSDSRKEEPEEAGPEPEEIGEDCVAFLRATKAIPAQRETKDCPTCPGSPATVEVLRFEDFKIDQVTFSRSNCQVAVRIHAQFNPSQGGTIVGGLTGWISPEEREQYTQGKTPPGAQVFKVKVIYQRRDGRWQAIEFDRD